MIIQKYFLKKYFQYISAYKQKIIILKTIVIKNLKLILNVY